MSTTIEYQDPSQEFRGYLVYDGDSCRVAAGGCRVAPGLTSSVLSELAAVMTVKQRILGVNVDGAKCGIDFDPHADGADAALGRFVEFLGDQLRTRLSMGCDMGTRWQQLERLARAAGVPSIKMSLRAAQSLSEPEFFARLALLDEPVGRLTLGQRRAGHALAHAARVTAARTFSGASGLTFALQGFGNLGRGAACAFAEWGSTVVAVADEHGCARDLAGLDLWRLVTSPAGTAVGQFGAESLCRDALFNTECDVLVLAAAADAVTAEQAAALPCRVVVVGANSGLSVEAEEVLVRRGVLVVPDFLGGIGGSASMEVLFGWEQRLAPRSVLTKMEILLSGLLDDVLTRSEDGCVSPRQAGLVLAGAAAPDPDAPPYGHSPYLSHTILMGDR